MPGSSPGRTPSPSPGIIMKEDTKLLSPGSWNEDKTSKGGGSLGGSKPNSKPNSRPTTPSTSTSAPAPAAPEGGGQASSRGTSRTPSRQSNKNEQGSDLEIKPLQKFDAEVKAPEVPVAAAATPTRNSLVAPDDEEPQPRPASKVSLKAVTPEPKPMEVKPERAPSVHERVPSVSENRVESRETSRPSSKAETRPALKRQPSPAPFPKFASNPEPKAVPKQAEVKANASKPAPKVEPKAETRVKALVANPIKDMSAESLELEVRQ